MQPGLLESERAYAKAKKAFHAAIDEVKQAEVDAKEAMLQENIRQAAAAVRREAARPQHRHQQQPQGAERGRARQRPETPAVPPRSQKCAAEEAHSKPSPQMSPESSESNTAGESGEVCNETSLPGVDERVYSLTVPEMCAMIAHVSANIRLFCALLGKDPLADGSVADGSG